MTSHLEVYFPFRWRQADVQSWVARRGKVKLTQLRTSVIDEVVTFQVETRKTLPTSEELDYSTKAYLVDTEVLLFFSKHDMPVPKTDTFWRMTDRVLGEISGVPSSRGLIQVTDGMVCWIERSDESLFRGHASWFEPDDESVDVEELVALRPVKKRFKAEEIDVLLTE